MYCGLPASRAWPASGTEDASGGSGLRVIVDSMRPIHTFQIVEDSKDRQNGGIIPVWKELEMHILGSQGKGAELGQLFEWGLCSGWGWVFLEGCMEEM